MHLVLKKAHLEKLKNYLQTILGSIRSKNVLIKTDRNHLVLCLSTEHSYIKLELPPGPSLVIKEPGEVLVNVKTFADLITKLDLKKDLEIYRADKNYLQFFSGAYECDLILSEGEDIQDLNLLQETEGIAPIRFPLTILKDSFNKLKDFCKNFESSVSLNPVLTNIHFKKKQDNPLLEIWASDSYRAMCGEFKFEAEQDFKFNLPPSIVSLLLGLFSTCISIDFFLIEDEEYLICNKEVCTIKTKLNNLPYPSFEHWFSMQSTLSFSANKQDLLDVIDRNLLLPDKELKTTLYRVEGDRLFIEYKNSEKGKCKEFLEIKDNRDKKIEFCLNNNLLRGLIKSIDSTEIVFKIYDSLKPIVLLPNTESNFKQFILPARNV